MHHFCLKVLLLKLIFIINTFVLSNDFKLWIASLESEVLKFGISKHTYNNTIKKLEKPNSKVLKYYNNQPEFKITFNKYYDRNINSKRVTKGKELLKKHNHILKEIYKKYDIPPEIIVAIWGIETNYGSYTGNFNVIEALSTLAFKSNRKEFFKKELFNSMLIIEKQISNSQNVLIGSWAGAMGQSQFMPSSYLEYAVDYNKDNKIDIWTTHNDIFASIANYLKRHGWKKSSLWSKEIFIKKEFENNFKEKSFYYYPKLINMLKDNNYIDSFNNNEPIEIKVIKSNQLKRYFIKSANFNVIKKYNNSDFYALVIGALANKIKY